MQQQNLNIQKEVQEKIYQSPFFYEDQVKLFVWQGDTDVNSPEFIHKIGNQINEISESAHKLLKKNKFNEVYTEAPPYYMKENEFLLYCARAYLLAEEFKKAEDMLIILLNRPYSKEYNY